MCYFGKAKIVISESLPAMNDDFDPFGLKNHDSNSQRKSFASLVETSEMGSTRQQDCDSESALNNSRSPTISTGPSASRTTKSAVSAVSKVVPTISLPPKLTVKLSIHEEASSLVNSNTEGSSEVSIEGRISAQVQCSDAKRNVPFRFEPERQNEPFIFQPSLVFRPEKITSSDSSDNVVHIPKHEIGFVQIGSYSLTKVVQHMPILLERRVTVKGTSCRVAIQVRSKLSNKGDVNDFTIALAVPEYVSGDMNQIVQGDGVWDQLKRTIKWTRKSLKKGESFVISALFELFDDIDPKELQFPVLLRCSSTTDPISAADFKVMKAEGQPASITVHKSYSFLLLHRLP